MKAPKLPTKIYFTILDMGSGYVYTPSLDDNGGTEYIRKDALLEWAKELRENARASRENPPSIEFDRYMEGKEKTISKFIDKLNSL